MPAALDVDHDKVRAVAMVVGVREAARQFELSEDAVRKWSEREGWFKHTQVVQAAILEKQKNQGLSPAVTKSQSDVLLSLCGKSKLVAAKVGHNTLKAINKEKGQALIACAPAFNSTVKALDTVHNWSEKADNRTLVNINLLNSKLPDA